MRGRARDIDETVLAELKADIQGLSKSWKLIAAANVLLLTLNFIFVGYFFIQYDHKKQRTVDSRFEQLRAEMANASTQLKSVDQDFSNNERNKKVSDQLSNAAQPFNLLYQEELKQVDFISAYLLTLKIFVEQGEETSEWLELQKQRLSPLVDRANARAQIFKSSANKIQGNGNTDKTQQPSPSTP